MVEAAGVEPAPTRNANRLMARDFSSKPVGNSLPCGQLVVLWSALESFHEKATSSQAVVAASRRPSSPDDWIPFTLSGESVSSARCSSSAASPLARRTKSPPTRAGVRKDRRCRSGTIRAPFPRGRRRYPYTSNLGLAQCLLKASPRNT